jgi:hypothetical protein
MSKTPFSKLIAIHQVQVLAVTFSRLMTEQLGANLQQVILANAEETDKSICHSHDFIDSNQTMIDALEELGEVLNLQSEKQTSVINAAWSIAKAAKFTMTEKFDVDSLAMSTARRSSSRMRRDGRG